MSFLKKLGTILANLVGIVSGVGPIITPFLGSGKAATIAETAINDFTKIGQVILQVETALQGQKTGAAKLQAAIPLVANIVKTSELVAGHDIANDAQFTQGVQEVTQGVVDILNSLSANNVHTSGNQVSQVAQAANQAGEAAVAAQKAATTPAKA